MRWSVVEILNGWIFVGGENGGYCEIGDVFSINIYTWIFQRVLNG